MLDLYDRAFLITADTDLRAAVDTARRLSPEKEILVVSPPKRMRRARGLNPKYEIKPGRIANYLLKEKYLDKNGNVIAERPSSYAPNKP